MDVVEFADRVAFAWNRWCCVVRSAIAPPKANTAATAIHLGSRRCQRFGPRRTQGIAVAEDGTDEDGTDEDGTVEDGTVEDGADGVGAGGVSWAGGSGFMAANSRGVRDVASMLRRGGRGYRDRADEVMGPWPGG